MKCLTIMVDDREVFSGNVAEVQWSENDNEITVVGRFKASPGLLEQLQAVAEQAKAQAAVPGRQPGRHVNPARLPRTVEAEDADGE